MTRKEKLQTELIEHLMGFVYDGWNGSDAIKYLQTVKCKLCNKFASEISQLQEGEMYPREFVEWLIAFNNGHSERVGIGWRLHKSNNPFKEHTLEQTFDYWQSKVKPK